jgi:hypothetical protein
MRNLKKNPLTISEREFLIAKFGMKPGDEIVEEWQRHGSQWVVISRRIINRGDSTRQIRSSSCVDNPLQLDPKFRP